MAAKNILVVEDDKALMEAAKIKLEKNNFQVFLARTVPDALTVLQQNSPISLIWLDHYLIGRETGVDFLKAVKSEPTTREIPVLVVSNSVSPETIQAYKDLGAHKFYTKSDVKLDDLISEINQLT